jgi:phosphate starvation-inducible PhoH-like protein
MSKKRRLLQNEETTDLSVVFGQEIEGRNFKIYNKYDFNDTHKSFLQLLNYEHTKMVFIDGPAGSNKTYLSVLAALTKLSQKKVDNIIYIRSIVESASKSIGALPGEIDEKFKPWAIPLVEKLDELVSKTTSTNLFSGGHIKCIPVNFVRGMTFHDSFVIVDEAQNLSRAELTSILTRFGNNSQYVVIGDGKQSDIGDKTGFTSIARIFDDQESEQNGIHVFKFTEDDIVRSKILRLITRKLGAL